MSAILIYHDVLGPESGFPGPLAARYKHPRARFEEHLDALAAWGGRVGLIDSAPDAVLTFDDGGASALLAASLLEERGWRGHFFVTTGRVGTAGFLDADGVRELARRGHGVGSHSHTHPTYMGRLPEEEIAREWRQSRELLGEWLGHAPDGAAIPGGFLTPRVTTAAERCGYRWLMTSEPTRRPTRHGGLVLHGRYTIWDSTPPSVAAAYARGDRRARGRLWLEWRAKRAAKRLSPSLYDLGRRLRAGAGPAGAQGAER